MTTSEIPHHRHRYPQGDLPPLATPGKTTPQTAQPATRTDLHVAPLRLHEFATVATSMIVWARETGPGLRGCRPAAIDPAKADQRKVAHRLVVLGVVAVHDGPEELQRLAQSVDVVEMQSMGGR